MKRLVLVGTDAILPCCAYKSKHLTYKPKAYNHPPLEGLQSLHGNKPALRAKTFDILQKTGFLFMEITRSYHSD